MSTAIVILVLLAGAYVVAVLEGWATNGQFRLAGPIQGAAALLGRESIVTRSSDRIFFEVGPVLLLISALLAAAVLPLAPGLIITDLATGALFVNAALAYVMVALVMAGWAPDGVYAMVGGWRFLGQLIGYSMLIVMPITSVAMRAESLFTTDAVESQAPLWNVVFQPLGFVLFFLAALAVCFLPPFDLPTAPGELAGGVMAEYTGARLAIMRLARLVLVVTLSISVTVFFLGGWLGPVLPPWAWTLGKSLIIAAAMLFLGRYIPRVREEHFLQWFWKLGIPLALLNILYVGIVLLVTDG